MQSILPPTVRFKHWVYTLVRLFVATLLLIINLPILKRLVRRSREAFNWLWKKGLALRATQSQEIDDGEDGIEMEVV
jgi:hypothetical protein